MKVILIKHIHTGIGGVSSEDVWLQMEVELPIIDLVGLTIIKAGNQERIKEIVYNDDQKTISAYVEADETFHHGRAFDQKVFGGIIKEYLDAGWVNKYGN